MRKIFYLILGWLGLIMGAIGAILPVLPSFPFLLLAAFGFAKGSHRVETWFKSTNLYKENLESFVEDRTMTLKTKVKTMISLTIIFTISFIAMGQILIGRIVLLAIWLIHLIYFAFKVETKEDNT